MFASSSRPRRSAPGGRLRRRAAAAVSASALVVVASGCVAGHAPTPAATIDMARLFATIPTVAISSQVCRVVGQDPCRGLADSRAEGGTTSEMAGDGTVQFDLVVDSSDPGPNGSCETVDERATLAFAAGTIDIRSIHRDCNWIGPRIATEFVVTGGTGRFAGATGFGTEKSLGGLTLDGTVWFTASRVPAPTSTELHMKIQSFDFTDAGARGVATSNLAGNGTIDWILAIDDSDGVANARRESLGMYVHAVVAGRHLVDAEAAVCIRGELDLREGRGLELGEEIELGLARRVAREGDDLGSGDGLVLEVRDPARERSALRHVHDDRAHGLPTGRVERRTETRGVARSDSLDHETAVGNALELEVPVRRVLNDLVHHDVTEGWVGPDGLAHRQRETRERLTVLVEHSASHCGRGHDRRRRRGRSRRLRRNPLVSAGALQDRQRDERRTRTTTYDPPCDG